MTRKILRSRITRNWPGAGSLKGRNEVVGWRWKDLEQLPIDREILTPVDVPKYPIASRTSEAIASTYSFGIPPGVPFLLRIKTPILWLVL